MNTLVQFCGEHAVFGFVSILCLGFAQFSSRFELEEEFCKGYAPQLNFHFDKVREETRWFDMF